MNTNARIRFLRSLTLDTKGRHRKTLRKEAYLANVATALSLFAAIFVGFLQLPTWILLPLTVTAVWGIRAYEPYSFPSVASYIWPSIASFMVLSIASWVAYLASLYMTGHQFVHTK